MVGPIIYLKAQAAPAKGVTRSMDYPEVHAGKSVDVAMLPMMFCYCGFWQTESPTLT
jgi:hypothetical protein